MPEVRKSAHLRFAGAAIYFARAVIRAFALPPFIAIFVATYMNRRPGEAGFLSVFDLNRDLIRAAAARVYARGRKGRYEIDAADLG